MDSKAEIDCDPGKAAVAAEELMRTELLNKRREERIKRRLRDRALPAKPPMTKLLPAISDEAFEIQKQELSGMLAKAMAEKSTLSKEAFKRQKLELSASVTFDIARNQHSTLSTEAMEKRNLDLSALAAKIRSAFSRSST